MANTETRTRTKTNSNIKEPPMFRVIYLNDDKTTLEFVISSLVTHFNYNQETAMKITVDIHEKGSAVVAVLPYEVAEQKGIEATLEARTAGFPLQIKLEPDGD